MALKGLRGHGGNAARKAVVQGAWTEQHLHDIGRADTPECKACEAHSGTRQHRYYQCAAEQLQAVRWRQPNPTWAHVAEQSQRKLLWTRGLVRDPSVDWEFQEVGDDATQWYVPAGEDSTFTGSVCIDGSRLGIIKAARSGWAAVQLKDSDQVPEAEATKTGKQQRADENGVEELLD